MKDIIPFFTTDSSLGKSILTSDEPKDKIDEENSISVWTIAKVNDLNPIYITEDSVIGFMSHYKYSTKLNKQLIFGVKFKVVNDSLNLEIDSFKTESNVIIFMKNSAGYKDLIKLYSAVHGDPNRCIWDKYAMKHYNRADWRLIQKYWTDNLLLIIPFYDSFLHRNLLEFGHHSIPEFGQITPTFVLESHDLPFDKLIVNSVINYCKENKYEIIDGHSIYYYKNEDVKPYQVFKCISNRTTYDNPDFEHFSSNQFSFESYLEKCQKKYQKENHYYFNHV